MDERLQARLRQIEAACVDRDRVATGWTPGPAQLDGAPWLHAWGYDHNRGAGFLSLSGLPGDESGGRMTVAVTSPILLVRYDGERGYARTWSRWYVLCGRAEPDLDECHHPASFEAYTSTLRPETARLILEIGYQPPPADLEPTAAFHKSPLAYAPLALALAERNRDPRAWYAYLALRGGCTPDEARAYATTATGGHRAESGPH